MGKTVSHNLIGHVGRFWGYVDIRGEDECWEWKNAPNPDGYGIFYYGNRAEFSHRVAWKLYSGKDIPDNLRVLHKCDNPPCCNPKHLFLGTQSDNIRDREIKGRGGNHKGRNNGRAILFESDVIKIKQLRNNGLEYKKIAEMFDVSVGCVSHILNGRHWKWVE